MRSKQTWAGEPSTPTQYMECKARKDTMHGRGANLREQRVWKTHQILALALRLLQGCNTKTPNTYNTHIQNTQHAKHPNTYKTKQHKTPKHTPHKTPKHIQHTKTPKHVRTCELQWYQQKLQIKNLGKSVKTFAILEIMVEITIEIMIEGTLWSWVVWAPL